MHKDLHFCCAGMEESVTNPSSLARQSAWSTLLAGLADSPVASLANVHDRLSNRPSKTSIDVGADLHDWRTPLLAYLRDPSAKLDKSVWQVLSNMCCTMMSFTEEPPKTCC
jgi:hypothetical protein